MFVTIAYMFVVSLKWVEFFGETDPIEYFSEGKQSMLEPINMSELGFIFAIDSIDERLGTIKVTHVDWSGTDGVKNETEIELVKCDTIGQMELSN